jgi:hypothetical protein
MPGREKEILKAIDMRCMILGRHGKQQLGWLESLPIPELLSWFDTLKAVTRLEKKGSKG